ncbi:MAG TPA: ankyrin repeat domain-containing protein [Anaerolineales bacterium]
MPNPNVKQFFTAIKEGKQEVVERLLRATPGLIHEKEDGLSPILVAAYHSRMKLAYFLAEKAITLTIFEAAATGKMNHIMRILAHDPQLVNAYSDDGYQPLGLACFFGNLETARYLINSGARVNSPSQNEMNVTPLHSAAAGGHTELVKLLLEHGANPNAVQKSGFTPLHAAAQNGDVQSIHALLFHGADADIKSAEGKTPLDYAAEGNKTKAVELLKREITRRFRVQ